MTHFLLKSVRSLAAGMAVLAFAGSASAQLHRSASTSSHYSTSSSANISGGVGSRFGGSGSESGSLTISASMSANGRANPFSLRGFGGGFGNRFDQFYPFSGIGGQTRAYTGNPYSYGYTGAAAAANSVSGFYRPPYPSAMYGYGGYPLTGGYGILNSGAYGSGGLGAYGGGGGGGYGGGGGGISESSNGPAYLSNYGAAIQPAISGNVADDIAWQQAKFQGTFQNFDLMERRLQLKRATFDEAMYEKMNTPLPETVREELWQQRLVRARNTPPLDEIASGQALNVLLTDIQRLDARHQLSVPSAALDADTLAHVNVTTNGDLSGSNELFKPGAFAKWPSTLAGEGFLDDRKKIMTALVDAARAQREGLPSDVKAAEARKLVQTLRDRVFENRSEASFTDYVNALEFLNKLTDTVNILSKQDASNYLNGTYSAKGNNVAELANHMILNGLKFWKASPGNEPYYSKLYQLLVTYDLALSKKADEPNSAKQVRNP